LELAKSKESFVLDRFVIQVKRLTNNKDQCMAKKVFFSFHYEDVIQFRANVVRNHWMTKPDREEAGYFDKSVWESAKSQNATGLKRLINGALDGTSASCVLVGTSTYARPWVRYEILKSFKRGNKLLAVHINSIRGKDQQTKSLGTNPLSCVGVSYSTDGQQATLWESINGKWIEYSEIDGSSKYAVNVGQQWRGNGYNLGNFYPIYDWVADDGFNNFSSWIS
jgi:hypothetical protein